MLRSTLAFEVVKIGSLAARSSMIVITAMIVMVMALTWVVTGNLATIRAAGDQLHHSAAVDKAAGNLLTAAINQETGIRGYWESGDREFLTPFKTGQKEFRVSLETMRALTREDAAQTARVAALEQAMVQWNRVYAAPKLRTSPMTRSSLETAVAGKIAMDEVRLQLAEVRSQEARMATLRSAARDRAYEGAYLALFGVGALVLIIGLGLGVWALALVSSGERRAREQAESKTRILAVVSHEIRTPLNGLLGMLQAIACDGLPKVQSDRVSMALDAGRTLTILLDDLLEASKLEAGRLELVEVAFDIEVMLRGIEAIFEPLALAGGVDFSVDVAPDARGIWIGDKVRLGQICTNLVSNAVKFTPAGRVHLSVMACDKKGLTLSVTDNGIGMDTETIDRLFSPFTQANAQTAHQFGGTGLGLSISRALARLMGGDILVFSSVGQGSTFTVHLPLARGSKPAKDSRDASSLPGLRVLAADDNATNREVLAAVLPSLGMNVALVHDGFEAVSAWAVDQFDVVLLDLRMPGCDGFEAARRIRALEQPGGRRTPLILVSADLSPHVQDEGRRAGLDGFVSKPLDLKALADEISRVAASRTMKQAA